MLSIDQTFPIAVQHHQAGRLPQAEQLYRQVLAQQPKHADALHNLGIMAHQFGRNDIAIDLIRQALAVKPNWPEALSNLGNGLKTNGQLDEAIGSYRRAIALKSDYPEAHYNLGAALQDKGQLDEAIAAYRTAIMLRPSYSDAHNNLGNALWQKGQLDDAIAACRQAIALRPDNPQAHSNLGNALRDKGQLDEAIAACRRAIVLKSDYAEAHLNLGTALWKKGQKDQAIASYRQAIALRPNYALAHGYLGSALSEEGQLDEAIASFHRAIALDSNSPEAYSGLGIALQRKGQIPEAIAAYHQAIALRHDFAEVHHNLALALLTRGNFAQGWEEYEWRWKCKEFPTPPRNFARPLWDGQPLAGATLFLHAEQGFGDTLQFLRYLPLVRQRATTDGKIIIGCQAELQRLIRPAAGDCPVVAEGGQLPVFDVHCPLLSLPRLFGTTLENIPREVPYLHADAAMIEQWRERLGANARAPHNSTTPPPDYATTPPITSLKVGLAWAGRTTHPNDRNRSIALSAFAPLARVPGVSFYSLQKGERAEQIKNAPAGLTLTDWTEELTDFADTAALIANLDLIIAVDTAVVHLAGAMGKPVWVLLPLAPDWRWLLQRQDSPWYPTMRLFRQPAIGDWGSVILQLRNALAALLVAPATLK